MVLLLTWRAEGTVRIESFNMLELQIPLLCELQVLVFLYLVKKTQVCSVYRIYNLK